MIKLSAAGALQWIYQTGTSADDVSGGLAVDSSGNVVLGGSTYGSSLGGKTEKCLNSNSQRDALLCFEAFRLRRASPGSPTPARETSS